MKIWEQKKTIREKKELSPELDVAIREHIRKMITVPAIIVSLIMFAIGFFINDVAKENAYRDAYFESMDDIRKTQDKFDDLTKTAYEMKYDLIFSIKDIKEESQKNLEESKNLRAQMDASTEWLKNIQKAEERMANYLATTSDFMDKVANKYRTEIKKEVDGLLKSTDESLESLKAESLDLKSEVENLRLRTRHISVKNENTVIDAGKNYLAIQQDGNVVVYKKVEGRPFSFSPGDSKWSSDQASVLLGLSEKPKKN